MNIEQTCKITLTPDEVREALAEYIKDKTRYRTNFRSYNDVISYRMGEEPEGPITVLWGEAPSEAEEETAIAVTPNVPVSTETSQPVI